MIAPTDQTNIASLVFSHLEMAVIRVVETTRFELAGPSFWWLEQFFFQLDAHNGRLTPLDRSPFFEEVLEQAQLVWRSPENARWASGPWVEVDEANHTWEWPFEAHAVCQDGQPLLLITLLGESYAEKVEMLQISREGLLDNERLEAEVSRRTQEIREREEEVANRLLAAAGYRDLETGAHVKRIGLYAELMAKALGWPTWRSEDLRMAAPMHDLGKIAIPDRVLLKPGPLDDAEFAIMKTHAELGARILGGTRIPMLEMAREIAWSHHERWDGLGYPRQLRHDEIPIEARIVSIFDVYDAMVYKRVYKAPISENETLQFLRDASHQRFEPLIVEAFFDHYPAILAIREQVREPDEPAATLF